MLESFVLRLVGSALRAGSIVGEVHVIGSGERIVVHDSTELLDALRSHCDVPSLCEENR